MFQLSMIQALPNTRQITLEGLCNPATPELRHAATTKRLTYHYAVH